MQTVLFTKNSSYRKYVKKTKKINIFIFKEEI
jgi:hypothetical protein